MSAHVPCLALLTAGLVGIGMSAGPLSAGPRNAIAAQAHTAERAGALVVRTGLYAVCGWPAGYAIDRVWLSRALPNHHAEMARMPMLIAQACGMAGAPVCAADCSPCAEPPAPQVAECPYMKKQANTKPASEAQAELPGSVLENLEKLLQAQKVYDRGDALRRQGKVQKARACFEQVQTLCPGSRLDAQAAEQMEQMARKEKPAAPAEEAEEQEVPAGKPEARKPGKFHDPARVGALLEKCRDAFESGDYRKAEHLMHKASWKLHQLQRPREAAPAPAEEESHECPCESCPFSGPPCGSGPGCSARPGVEAQVEELLSDCHQAMAAGRYDEAVELARKALALDPASVAADGLIYKTHMLIHLQEKAGKDCLDGPAGGDGCYPGCVQEPSPRDAARPRSPLGGERHADSLKEIVGRSWDPFAPEPALELEEPCEDGMDNRSEKSPAGLELIQIEGEPNLAAGTHADFYTRICQSISESVRAELDHGRPCGVRFRCELEIAGKTWRAHGESSGNGHLRLELEVDSPAEDDAAAIRWLSGGPCD